MTDLNNFLLNTARLERTHSDTGRKFYLVVGGDSWKDQVRVPLTTDQALDMGVHELPEEDLLFYIEAFAVKATPAGWEHLRGEGRFRFDMFPTRAAANAELKKMLLARIAAIDEENSA